MLRILSTFFLLFAVFAGPVAAENSAGDSLDFSRDVRPILSDKCFGCHGPDEEARQADLRLDTREGLFADRGGYRAVAAGDPESSEIIRRITSSDAYMRMPPADSKLELADEEIALLRRWIEQGAPWSGHWAFEPVVRPPLPEVPEPTWPRNPLDRFVGARLDDAGLAPSPEADKPTLIRRLTLDLTGLPPTPEEIAAFLADDSPGAYERLVDRLLASPRYGERMALMWLDAARYADTDGYQNDGPRSMWRWRDWVIGAYNDNLPFDRFTLEQLAGDLLENAERGTRNAEFVGRGFPRSEFRNPRSTIATGFNRNHRYNSEAGLVLEEFLLENAVDRVDTAATVWMGLTMGCARCHDHKYDPFSQKEYYRLIAFFDNASESGRAVKFGNSEPWVVAPTTEQAARLAEHERRVMAAAATLEDAEAEIAAAQERWEQSASDGVATDAPVVSRGLKHYFPLDGDDSRVKVEAGRPVFRDGVVGAAATVGGSGQFRLGAVGEVHCQKRSTVAFWLRPEEVNQGVILSRQTTNTRRPGLAVELRDGRLQFYIVTRWVSGVGAVETRESLAPGQWVHVCLTNDGSQSARGMNVFLNGRRAATRVLHNTNSNTGGTDKGAVLRIGGGVHGPRFKGQVDELRFYERTLWDDEISLLAVPETIEEIRNLPIPERTETQRATLRAWFLEHAAPASLKKLADAHFQARQDWLAYWDGLPTTMVMDEMDPPRQTFVRMRGVYHQHGEQVTPGAPQVFPPLPEDAEANRLAFARWLVSGKHPLTARVAVNRYWQQYFGVGLVRTSEDWGVQGEPPSHPQLLDWLAAEFVASGWDVKRMHRLIVASATYRQSSQATPELLRRDPANRLLARGPRGRLSAHAIRDQALSVAGLLSPRIGGPSVSPYQPADLWKEMSNMTYRQGHGEDLYRRSLYTIWKRTVAPPTLSLLDAADRETCAVRPKRTNTPLQALTLLNETAFVEAARNLAQRMLLEGGDSPLEFGFRAVTGRRPKPHELSLLENARDEYLEEFRADPAAAEQLLQVGESRPANSLDPITLAAYTAVANVLFNLDEAVTKQ